MEKQSISVVLATFNEEKNIAACLEGVKDLASEIIVVDGQSSDKTVEIAKRYGARVKITTNKPIFHINKQMAIDMAKSAWVLQLDADERVDKNLESEIKKSVNSKKFNGYWIPRKNFFLGRFLMKGGQYPDYTLRLYRNGKGKLPQKSVHEQAIVDGQVGYLKNPLIHLADPNFSRYIKRWKRYVSLIADELKNKNKGYDPVLMIKYLIILPLWWFLLTYIRHKGFMDSWQGFVFSFFSSLRFPASYLLYIKRKIDS